MTKSIRLTADIGECGGAVIWTSKNTDVAILPPDGTVTPVKVGTADRQYRRGKGYVGAHGKSRSRISLNHAEFAWIKAA
ncbi:MAG: hypothetical protein ACLRSW_09350 [Christensenellaceae bacterium]